MLLLLLHHLEELSLHRIHGPIELAAHHLLRIHLALIRHEHGQVRIVLHVLLHLSHIHVVHSRLLLHILALLLSLPLLILLVWILIPTALL